MDEFALIARYFRGLGPDSALLSVGDDCALMQLQPGEILAVTTDTLVSGVHFPVEHDPESLARRCLRVNLSDLAAMGAEPRWFQLALTLPTAAPVWLEAFSAGLAADARDFGCQLTGGDTTRGPLTITLTLLGVLPAGRALTRGGARLGDLVYVSGSLGDSRAALELIAGREAPAPDLARRLLQRFWLPEPRLDLGRHLRGIASAAIDISDGLLADLGHICERSGVGAEVAIEHLPMAPALQAVAGERAIPWALTGGDDYELCFAVPPVLAGAIAGLERELDIPLTRVGRITDGSGVRCVDTVGGDYKIHERGYAHF